ncbi:MAG: cytochrome C [Gemmatimonadaceae bacterium]
MFAPLLLALAVAGSMDASPAMARRAPSGERVTGPALALMMSKLVVPSFSRQTKLACNVCHYAFPQLTPFGRLFKLNGYTMTGLPTINSQADTASRMNLQLSPIAPLSVMAIVSNTRTSSAVPGTRNGTSEFPQQLSFFASTQVTPKVGMFTQFTYEGQDNTFRIDNTDIRFANHTSLNAKDVIYGVTLHNNPTVQDVWNTLPAWGYPFNASGTTPGANASTLIDGTLAQSVLGLGTYALYDNLLYAEVSAYTSAPQGASAPADSTSTNTTRGLSPYWRVALQRSFGATYLMVGGFGMQANLFPSGVTGPTNRYRDLGLDAQLETKAGPGTLIGRASYVKENQVLPAFFGAASANPTNTLNTFKANISYMPSTAHVMTAGIFGTTGSADALLYPSEPVLGSASGSPSTQGATLEYSYNPWLNTRLGAQYTMYTKFNGASRSYDELNGRNAKGNNSLYLFLWLAY